MAKPTIVVLGAGPAGLGAAFRVTRRGLAKVVVLEREDRVGGVAGSFDLAGVRVDYGSHRLHPACQPDVLHDIQTLLGEDLLNRPRCGRIRLRGRWIRFPLQPVDLLLRLPLDFASGVLTDLVARFFIAQRRRGRPETFSSELERRLGRTVCREFYFPYVRKIWGVEPDELSVALADRRVSTSSMRQLLQKALSRRRDSNIQSSTQFYYPRRGFGQICEAYCQAAREAGAQILLQTAVRSVELEDGTVSRVLFESDGKVHSILADHVWSTIPMRDLVRCLVPSAPPHILDAALGMQYRAMILVYLVVDQERFTEFDAHYFPEVGIPISRLSEPPNYRDRRATRGPTVLCAELPCAADGPEWKLSDEQLAHAVRQALEAAQLPLRARVKQVLTKRLRYAYPIYHLGYENLLDQLDRWLSQFVGLLCFGRHGLFMHDNIHHALFMGYAAAKCLLENQSFDESKWQSFRKHFDSEVVQD